MEGRTRILPMQQANENRWHRAEVIFQVFFLSEKYEVAVADVRRKTTGHSTLNNNNQKGKYILILLFLPYHSIKGYHYRILLSPR